MLKTMITGSLPKPSWLADRKAELRAPWAVGAENLAEAQDDAVRLAIADQVRAGLDVVTDGEERRRHYIWGFLDGLTGIDTARLAQKVTRGGRYGPPVPVPRVVGKVERTGPVLIDALRFAMGETDLPVKVTLPGPMTIVDTLVDEAMGGSEADLAMHFADILNAEARELASSGASIVQFDEPCFNIYVDKVADWGIAALERAALGVEATRAVHICYGYGIGTVLEWKSKNQNRGEYGVTLPLLERSSIDQISVECAASGVDLSVLEALKTKEVMVGVIDVGTEDVESPELVAERIRKALVHVDAERLIPCTDCGLVPRSRSVARRKMEALAEGARRVRESLTGIRVGDGAGR
jgi:5-methyltetrahydropteroyltriglutamate--homocysteine methyltransferase